MIINIDSDTQCDIIVIMKYLQSKEIYKMNNATKLRAAVIDICTNLWFERGNELTSSTDPILFTSAKLRCDKAIFHEYTEHLASLGINALILNIGDALRYETHPELAVEGAWTVNEMKSEIERLKGLGFEVIPMLDFSTAHDEWLGDYSHMISTSPYYKVCADLIREVCYIFDPKYMHIGMADESAAYQKEYEYMAVRHNELWWHDIYFLLDRVQGEGVTAIVYGDRMHGRSEEFIKGMPTTAIIANPYNGHLDPTVLSCYNDLKQDKYIQLPAYVGEPDSKHIALFLEYVDKTIPKEKLLGYICIPDAVCDPSRRDKIFAAANSTKGI